MQSLVLGKGEKKVREEGRVRGIANSVEEQQKEVW